MAVVTMNMTAQEAYYRNLPMELKRVSMPQIPDRQVSLKDVGDVGDGVTLCTEAFEKGIAQLAAQGGDNGGDNGGGGDNHGGADAN